MPESTSVRNISTRATVVALKALGNMTSANIAAQTGISLRQVHRIYARAIERGFDPNERPFVLKDEWLEDSPRSGCPTK